MAPSLGHEPTGRALTPPDAAAHYEREVEEAVDALTAVIEPLLVVVLGLAVGGILIAIYLPMFELVDVIE